MKMHGVWIKIITSWIQKGSLAAHRLKHGDELLFGHSEKMQKFQGEKILSRFQIESTQVSPINKSRIHRRDQQTQEDESMPVHFDKTSTPNQDDRELDSNMIDASETH
jgi:hypothetical protein